MNAIFDLILDNPVIFWMLVGTLCLIVEVLAPWGFFLSFAVSSYILALLTWLGVLPWSFMGIIAIWAAIAVALIVPMKILIRRYLDRQPDINVY